MCAFRYSFVSADLWFIDDITFVHTSLYQTLQACISSKQCRDLPVAMCGGQSVVIDGKVYFGGGKTKNVEDCYLVHRYDPSRDKWTTLPDLPVRYFGLGQVDGKLVAVGGEMKKNDQWTRSSEVFTFVKSWKRSLIPSMATARLHPAVISHKSALIVVGGEHFDEVTRTVEIFIVDESMWYSTRSLLPTACFGASCVISDCEDKCYILGGRNDQNLNLAMYALVNDLLQDTIQANPTVKPQEPENLTLEELRDRAARHKTQQESLSPWKMLQDTVTYSPAATMLAGSLLTIGGWETPIGGAAQAMVHRYCPSANAWIHISDLPAPRAGSTAAALSPAEVLVIGGWDDNYSEVVYKLSLCLK